MADGSSTLLLCHPAALSPAVAEIEVAAATGRQGLILRYQLSGRMGELAIPGEASPVFADHLWEHTCFEAFIALAGVAAYREFNFSPSGRWAAYGFSAYRQREEEFVPAVAPAVLCRHDAGALELEARIPAALLPAGSRLELGLTAVIESRDGRRSYWALGHGDGKPDFHRRETFRLVLNTATP